MALGVGSGFAAGGPNANTDDWPLGYRMRGDGYPLFRISWKGLFRADFTGFIGGFLKGLAIFGGHGAVAGGMIGGLGGSVAYAIVGDN
jgi:hypothetical protein